MAVCFHNPEEENGYLSNWYLSRFTADGVEYTSMEQYMMHKKALCFGDEDTAREILATDDVGKIKALGRQVSGYSDSVWNGVRQIVVYEGLMAKFSQNDELLSLLLQTNTAVLAECAVNDKIWGNGMSMKDPDRHDISKWKGQNLLGYTLMAVRAQLQNQTR